MLLSRRLRCRLALLALGAIRLEAIAALPLAPVYIPNISLIRTLDVRPEDFVFVNSDIGDPLRSQKYYSTSALAMYP
jgi:hypothetical protein